MTSLKHKEIQQNIHVKEEFSSLHKRLFYFKMKNKGKNLIRKKTHIFSQIKHRLAQLKHKGKCFSLSSSNIPLKSIN